MPTTSHRALPAVVEQTYFGFAPPTLVHTQETILQKGEPDLERPFEPCVPWAKLSSRERQLATLVEPATALEASFRHSGWAKTRAAVLEALKRCCVPLSRVERFAECGACCMVQRLEAGDLVRTVANYCHDRFCLPCGVKRSQDIAANLVAFMDGSEARHMVLTLRHADEPLAKLFDRLVESFAKMRRAKFWGESVRGGAYFFECKRSESGEFWHPHLHCILVGSYISQKQLSEEWLRITGDSKIVYIRRIEDEQKVASYVAKYATKPLDPSVFREPDWLDECVRALGGRRLCGTFGEWRGRGLEDQPADGRVWINVGRLDCVAAQADRGCLASQGLMVALWPDWRPAQKGTSANSGPPGANRGRA